jgi:hypothetical protein
LRIYITQAELLAAVAICYTCAPLLRRRRVVHYINNTGALSALVHSYASKVDCARIVNVYHVQAAALSVQFWGEWVPSKANPGDVPTRPERAHEMGGMARRATMEAPPPSQTSRLTLESRLHAGEGRSGRVGVAHRVG